MRHLGIAITCLAAFLLLSLTFGGCAHRRHPTPTTSVALAPVTTAPAEAPVTISPAAIARLVNAPSTEPSVLVTIDDSKIVNQTDEDAHGTNEVCFWNDNTADSPGTVKAFSQMGLKLLRFPGGVPCHYYDYNRGDSADWKDVSCQQAWNIAKAGGARMVIQTNIAQNKHDIDKKTGKEIVFNNTGEYQAGWLAHAKERGYDVAFWEIGNEPEMDAPGQYKRTQASIMQWYNARYDDQARAIRKVDPNARIMGPATTNEWFWWHEDNLAKFLAAHGDKQGTGLADILSVHWYTDTGGKPWKETRKAPQEWQRCMAYLKSVIAKYDTRDLPLYVTEWNFGGAMDQESCRWLGTGLGNADTVGMFMREGVKGETHFCLMGTNKNWGMLAQKGQSADEGDPTPTYFALSMASKIRGRILDTRVNVDEKNVFTAYSALDGRGAMNVMLINKSETAQTATVSFKNFQPAGRKVQLYGLQGINGDPRDTSVIYNGVKAPEPNHVELPVPRTVNCPAQLSLELPAYSMAVAVFENAGPPIPMGITVLPPVRQAIRDLPPSTQPAAALKPITPVSVAQAPGKMVIDCDDAKWAAIAPMPSPFANQPASSVKLCWTDVGLVGRLDVKDDNVQVNPNQPWKKDCLELWIEKDAARSTDPGKASVQYIFFPAPGSGAGKANVRIAYGTMDDNADKVDCQWKPVTGGYAMEFLIPADTLAPATMKEGTKLGFNWCIDVNAKPVEQFYSSKDKDGGYANPSTWGQIILSAEAK